MRLDDLIARLQSIQREAKSAEAAHPGIESAVHVLIKDLSIDIDLEVTDVVPMCAPGCGCYIGAYIIVDTVEE